MARVKWRSRVNLKWLKVEIYPCTKEIRPSFMKASSHSLWLWETSNSVGCLPLISPLFCIEMIQNISKEWGFTNKNQKHHKVQTTDSPKSTLENVWHLKCLYVNICSKNTNTTSCVAFNTAGCLSALAAHLTPGSVVLDSCAAPGSKTSHAIELLEGGNWQPNSWWWWISVGMETYDITWYNYVYITG